MWMLLLALAQGSDIVVVRVGQTVESIAADLGDPALAAAIRGENGLRGGAQPVAGAALRLPPVAGRISSDAVVINISGSGTITHADGTEWPMVIPATIPAGATACTEDDVYATLRLAADPETGEHDDANMAPGTCVRIDAATTDADSRTTTLTVLSGRVEIRTSTGTSTVNVLTEAGATSGPGGFRVSVEDDGAARTEALSRPVAVIGAGEEVDVGAGQGSRTRVGEAPSAPIDLLGPGALQRPGDGAPLLVHDFSWTPVEGALGYAIEISGAPDFSDIVYRDETPGSPYLPASLFLPNKLRGLWWRVTSFDYAGFEGVPSAPRRMVAP